VRDPSSHSAEFLFMKAGKSLVRFLSCRNGVIYSIIEPAAPTEAPVYRPRRPLRFSTGVYTMPIAES